MNEHLDSELLALYADGDLRPADLQYVTAHLAGCAKCRKAASDFDWALQILRSAAPEPSEQDLQLVRQGISARLERSPRRILFWSLGSAAAVLALIVLAITFSRPPTVVQNEVALQLPLPRPRVHLSLSLPETKRTVPQRSRVHNSAGMRVASFIPGSDGASQLRLTTADPHIVILLPLAERTLEHEV